jgi:hypothetical protein
MSNRILTLAAAGAVAATMALVGCSKTEQADVAKVGRDVSADMDRAKVATEDAAAKMSDKIDDAVITTSVKAGIAKDPALSALKVAVETDNGHVSLKGTAPSGGARERASTIAHGVKGVTRVDNQLMVQPG